MIRKLLGSHLLAETLTVVSAAACGACLAAALQPSVPVTVWLVVVSVLAFSFTSRFHQHAIMRQAETDAKDAVREMVALFSPFRDMSYMALEPGTIMGRVFIDRSYEKEDGSGVMSMDVRELTDDGRWKEIEDAGPVAAVTDIITQHLREIALRDAAEED